MNKDSILGVLRHILTFGGGVLTSKGLGTDEEITAGIGALITLIGVVWSIVIKRRGAQDSPPATALVAGATLASMLGATMLLCACSAPRYAAGADPVVVEAEHLAESSLDTLTEFVSWERENEVALLALNPEIHRTAERIRREAPQWLASLRNATRTYKAARSPENKSLLLQAQAVLQAALAEARTYIKQ